jgi:hypothetical protein
MSELEQVLDQEVEAQESEEEEVKLPLAYSSRVKLS